MSRHVPVAVGAVILAVTAFMSPTSPTPAPAAHPDNKSWAVGVLHTSAVTR